MIDDNLVSLADYFIYHMDKIIWQINDIFINIKELLMVIIQLINQFVLCKIFAAEINLANILCFCSAADPGFISFQVRRKLLSDL